MNETSSKTTLGMDVARNRIRINRSVLRAIGNPAYVQLLINPESRIMAIRAVDRAKEGDQTYRMPKPAEDEERQAVITSKTFMTKLTETFPDLCTGRSVQLSGIIVPSERITLFSIDTMRIVNGNG